MVLCRVDLPALGRERLVCFAATRPPSAPAVLHDVRDARGSEDAPRCSEAWIASCSRSRQLSSVVPVTPGPQRRQANATAMTPEKHLARVEELANKARTLAME